jgi:8-oxo-dGTP diphosphatase
MARAPVVAAGGIVLRPEAPLIALVRLRKRNEWVLPKGKLDDGETPRDAAEREVLEETGHDVSVHEFLGTLVYESGGRSKVVHYWRMEAKGEQVHALMDDVKAVDWLPLDAALDRLSRTYERAFLANVGPLALETVALAQAARRLKANQPVPEKRRSRQPAKPPVTVPLPDLAASTIGQHEHPSIAGDVVVEADAAVAEAAPEAGSNDTAGTVHVRHPGIVQKLQDWLRRTI